MKYGIKCNGTPSFFLRYEENEWAELEAKLKGMGLSLGTSNNLWGMEKSGQFYRETNSELINAVHETLRPIMRTMGGDTIGTMTDNVNQSFFKNGSLNIAIFRVVPDADGYVYAPLSKFLTVVDINAIGKVMAKLYEVLFNTITEAEISIIKEA